MPWNPEVQAINQRCQFGAESTSALGTNVAATKLLECFDFVMDIQADIAPYTPTGHKYPNVQEENTEWVDITVGGNLDYNGAVYPLAGVCGSVAPASHAGSTIAKDWIYSPPTSGSVVPQTYTIEQGDAVIAHKVNYGLFTEFGYKGTRKDFTCSGKMIAQALQNAITLTPSPVPVPIAPVVAKQVNVYLDQTQAALGTTLEPRALSVDYLFTNLYGPLYPLNRAQPSWSVHVDLMPKATFKLKLEADVLGMGKLALLQSGQTVYIRVQALGGVIDNNQTVSLGAPSAGTFTLTYKGQTTAGIAFGATGATVQAALLLLTSFPAGTVTVSGGAGGPYVISLLTTLATDLTAITGSGAGLTGGTFLITQTQVYNEFRHDMAVKVGQPAAFADEQGVFAIEWECNVIEDTVWGKAQVFTVTNVITAL